MANTYFDQENHKELLSVALRGPYLMDFLRLSEGCSYLLENTNPPVEFEEEAASRKQQIQFQKDTVKEITKGLDSDKAKEFGIDGEDLKTEIKLATGIKIDLLTRDNKRDIYRAAYEKYSAGNYSFSDEMRQRRMLECAENLMYYFCACVALQEHKEKEFIETIIGERTTYIGNIQELIEEKKFQGKKPTQETINNLSYNLVMTYYSRIMLYQMHVKNNNPIAALEKKILFGNAPGFSTSGKIGGIVGAARKMLAELHGLNMNNHADRETLRHTEESILDHLAEANGFPLPSSLGLS